MKYRHIFAILAVLCACCSCAALYAPKEDDYSQDEAVNIGYTKVRKRDLTGSVAKVKVDDDDLSAYADIYEYLRGRVAGVEVNGTSVTIRGERSIYGSNEPLWLVDGAECSDPSSIAPMMIQSVEVLKDASVTAMYGSRGANGVILITLKGAQ